MPKYEVGKSCFLAIYQTKPNTNKEARERYRNKLVANGKYFALRIPKLKNKENFTMAKFINFMQLNFRYA